MTTLVLVAGGVLLALGDRGTTEGEPQQTVSYLLIAESEDGLPAGLDESVRLAGGTLTKSISKIGVAVASSSDPNFVARAERIAGIEGACPSPLIRRMEADTLYEVGMGLTGEQLATMDPPNTGDDDVGFEIQWGADAIDLIQQRDKTKFRGKGVRIAVIDSGADMDHPDLEPNINATLSESFVPGEGPDAEETPGVPDGDRFFNHGSHVAGICAGADNGEGIIGVAPEAELVIIKVLSEQLVPQGGCGLCEWVLDGIVYAGDIRSDVVNMSLGAIYDTVNGQVDNRCTPDDESDDIFLSPDDIKKVKKAFQRAVDYATKRGAVVVVAAGNETWTPKEDKDFLWLPAELKNVVSVGATGPLGWAKDHDTNLDELAFYSNYGKVNLVTAPGGNIDFSLRPPDPADWEFCQVGAEDVPCWVFDMVFSCGGNGSYWWAIGTSMASPHAAGVAALIIEANKFELTPKQVAQELKKTADDIGKKGRDDEFAHGRINAYEAVRKPKKKGKKH
jgi:subtilisin family serine protease